MISAQIFYLSDPVLCQWTAQSMILVGHIMEDTNTWQEKVIFCYPIQTSHCVIFIHLLLMTCGTWKLLTWMICSKASYAKDVLKYLVLELWYLWKNNLREICFLLLAICLISWKTRCLHFYVLDFLYMSKSKFRNSLLSISGYDFFASLTVFRNFACDSTFTVMVLYSFLGIDILYGFHAS